MRILWVKAGKLLPVDTGGKIRSYNLLRQLAARHETVLLSYYGGPRDDAYERELKTLLPDAVAVNTRAPDGKPLLQAFDYLRRLSSNAPYAVRKFTSPEVQHLLRDWMSDRRFDVAVCDFLSASLNFPRELTTPTILFQHNVESALWRRQAEHAPDPLRRLVFKLEAAKMLEYEQAAIGRFHHVIAVSEHDRDQMMQMADAHITVVPTGVDTQKYAAGQKRSNSNDSLVIFLGSMDWEPNIDGVEYFCRDIWPSIQRDFPAARFRIVGRNPHPRVRKLASASIDVTGAVPSVVEHLHQAAVVVVPLRVGGGTRLKIFEAMAAGKAVVSTPIGAEGLDVHHNRDILLAESSSSFAEAVVALLRDQEQRIRLGHAAEQLAEQYDWSVIARRFEETLARVAKITGTPREIEPLPASVNA